MPDIPLPQRGVHWSSILLMPLNISTAGVVTDATPSISLTGVIEGLGETLTFVNEEISPATSNVNHKVAVAVEASFNIDVFKVNNTTNANKLKQAMLTSNLARLEWIEGTIAGSIHTVKSYVLLEEMQSGLRGKGKQIASLRCSTVNVTDSGTAIYYVVT